MLPKFHTDSKDLQLLQDTWGAQLNPLLAKPTSNSSILKNVKLVTGTNVINTLLGRPLQGYKIVRQRAQASIYDVQDGNQTPSLTLLLVSDNPVSIDLEIF